MGILIFSVVLFFILRVCLTQSKATNLQCFLDEAFEPLEGVDSFDVLLDLNDFIHIRYPGFRRLLVRLYVIFSDDSCSRSTCRHVDPSKVRRPNVYDRISIWFGYPYRYFSFVP